MIDIPSLPRVAMTVSQMPRSITSAAAATTCSSVEHSWPLASCSSCLLGVSTVAPAYFANERLLGSTSTRLPAAAAAAMARAVTSSLSTPLP